MAISALAGWLLVAGTTLVVSPSGPYATIPEALTAAHAGDTVEVRGGVYSGPIVVDRSVTLVSAEGAIVDGGQHDTVVTVAAPDVTVRGFVLRGSGRDLNTGDAGIEVRAARATIESNTLEDVLFGISLDDAAGSVVRGNHVAGKALPIAERGDGLRLWYSSDVLVEDNRIQDTRDAVIWYSERVRLLGNHVERQRYGLHFMFDDGAVVEGNTFRDNSVGAYLMYSRGVTLRRNLMVANRGPSGYGLGLKDMDDTLVEENWLVDNRVGVWSDGSPRALDSTSAYQGNLIAYNDVGVTLTPATQRNVFGANTFQDNLEQVSIQGGGVLRGNTWSDGGLGNYWSDYRGFDANGDGIGDVPYRSEALLDDWADRRPELRLFRLGLAGNVLEFAARAFPSLRPAPRLVDDAPRMAAPGVALVPGLAPADSRPTLGVTAGLLALAAGVLAVARGRPSRRAPRTVARSEVVPSTTGPALDAHDLTCRFGKQVAVDRLSFEVAPGEVVALWGPNGAGKSSALKCVLGLLPYEGGVRIAGLDARRQGKRARRGLGHVPQEVAFHDDLTVLETIALYARLKRAPHQGTAILLDTLGLAEHSHKRVGALSGGLRQRLALGLALLGSPPLLVLDEPTSNLDATSRDQVLRIVAEQRNHGAAVLFASHRLEEVEALADRVLVLEHGRLVCTCSPQDLAERLGLRYHLRLRLSSEHRERALALLQAQGLESASRNGQSIGVAVPASAKALPIRLLEQAGIAVTDFAIEEHSGETSSEHTWTP